MEYLFEKGNTTLLHPAGMEDETVWENIGSNVVGPKLYSREVDSEGKEALGLP